MAKATGETPLMQQHGAIKKKYPDAILLFRVGDFYETFGQDAINTSKVLGITLTKRNNGNPDAAELAGFPHHSLETYLHKLVKAGYRVAVCDQLEDPKAAKGIVKRGVTELVTPGVAINDKLLENNSNNFLAALHFAEPNLGISFLDISTGEFFIAQGNLEYIEKLVQTLKPAEIIFQRNQTRYFKEVFGAHIFTYTLESWIFEEAFARESLLKHFQTHSLKGYGIDNMPMGIIAAGAILYYLKETEHPHLQHITQIQRIEKDQHLWMDRFTIRNLELLGNAENGTTSLLNVLDNTLTPMGARKLKHWLVLPLKDIDKINERLEAVSYLILHPDLFSSIQTLLKQCNDLERLASKISMKRVGPREVRQLARSLELASEIKLALNEVDNAYLKLLADQIDPCNDMVMRIYAELVEEPPAIASKGNLINTGIHAELDELKNIARSGKDYLLDLQKSEIARTGISSLKIGFNNVFGYYLEVTNLHKEKVPSEWIRKQTLTGAERYITEELKQYEEKITGAEEKILSIELAIYEKLVNDLISLIAPVQSNGNALAILDCLGCFAYNAKTYQYVKPIVHDGFSIELKESRHPVIERNLPTGESYITNDIYLDPEIEQIIILTGPNMSGKSALLRQTAIITLMAHMGSFVPASEAKISLTDKIFTRVGASDNLSGGESTFMVEMNETASIINNISSRSLVLLDEIGRGTSTYDGISIAWSIVEYLQNSSAKPKTLFATHYHELNELEESFSGVRNYHITNKEVGNKVIFLRKLARGGSTHSFGIHVARMAGMPPELIQRANDILKQLESKHVDTNQDITVKKGNPVIDDKTQILKGLKHPQLQLSIFDAHSEIFEQIREALNSININELTPMQALMKLNDIKNLLK